MNERACKSGDCDLNHCPKCGSHTLGYLEPFQRCSTCELEAEHNQETPLGEQLDDNPTTAELEAEAFQAQFDDEPNPYAGTYSEE